MDKATLKQAYQALGLIAQKNPSAKQLQALYASGLLSDLLEADVAKVDRVAFRGVLKLNSFKYDKAKDGWTLLEDVPFDGKQFIPDIVEFLQGESSVNGEVMKQRAKELNAHLGQHDAEYLLEHQELIPKKWRGKCDLVFPGTVWRNPLRACSVPCLSWSFDCWILHFLNIRYRYGGNDRLVRPRE